MAIRFNPRELLTVAIQIERNGHAYYTRMASQIAEPEIRKIMETLASAEQQHVRDFQKIEAGLTQQAFETPEEYHSLEMEGYLRSMADGTVFSNLIPVEEIAREIHTDIDAIRHAISFEKDTILFFHEILDLLPEREPNRKAVAELIRQEKIHIAQLYTMMKE